MLTQQLGVDVAAAERWGSAPWVPCSWRLCRPWGATLLSVVQDGWSSSYRWNCVPASGKQERQSGGQAASFQEQGPEVVHNTSPPM